MEFSSINATPTTSCQYPSSGSAEKLYNSCHTQGWSDSAKQTQLCSKKPDPTDFKQFKSLYILITERPSNGLLDSESAWKEQAPLALHNGLEAIASSLSQLSNTLGMAIEESRTLMYTEADNGLMERDSVALVSEKRQVSHSKLGEEAILEEKMPDMTKDKELKASRDVAMAMGTKAKLLLRELKGMKRNLLFTKDRCDQLEEENSRLRESMEKGVKHEEDDLVRLQLEALLTEKARLAQENVAYARENQFLHEVVQYHQLKLRNTVLQDADEEDADDDDHHEVLGCLTMVEHDIHGAAASPVDMDFVPPYPEEENVIIARNEGESSRQQQG